MNGASIRWPAVDNRNGDAYSDRIVFKVLWCKLETDAVCQAAAAAAAAVVVVVASVLFDIVVFDETCVDWLWNRADRPPASWSFRMCFFKSKLRQNPLAHILHVNGFLSLCVPMWLNCGREKHYNLILHLLSTTARAGKSRQINFR